MAMLPFCGYNMGDYWQHWLDMGKKITKKPHIFNVNWFRLDDEGNFMWPGFGDNFRVLLWILARCEGKANAVDTPIGYVPTPDDIDLTDLNYEIKPGHKFTKEDLASILTVEKDWWIEDLDSIKAFYGKFSEGKVPKELWDELATLENNLKK